MLRADGAVVVGHPAFIEAAVKPKSVDPQDSPLLVLSRKIEEAISFLASDPITPGNLTSDGHACLKKKSWKF